MVVVGCGYKSEALQNWCTWNLCIC